MNILSLYIHHWLIYYILVANCLKSCNDPILFENSTMDIPIRIIVAAVIFSIDTTSLKMMDDVANPEIGTKSDKGATLVAGYFFIKLFHIQYPNIVVI